MIINYLAIIPARSGSKSIKDKNIELINGKECFRYTLEPLIYSNIDKIFFSTDSVNYLNLYKKYYDKEKDVTGEYLRESEISNDNSKASDYIDNCLDYLKKKGFIVKNFIILQPTSLFRTTEQINKVIKFHQENNYETVKSLSPIIQTPYYMVYDDNSQVINNKHINRQEHKKGKTIDSLENSSRMFIRFKNDIYFSRKNLRGWNKFFRIFIYAPIVAIFKKSKDEDSLSFRNFRFRKRPILNLWLYFKAMWRVMRHEGYKRM